MTRPRSRAIGRTVAAVLCLALPSIARAQGAFDRTPTPLQGVDVTADVSNPKLTIRIASLDSRGSSTIGLCETGGGLRRVTFDPDFWNSVSETQRELLAHHELGHCVLYRGHRSELLSTGKYASIMYPIIMSSSTYMANYDYYQNELCTQAVQQMPDPTQSSVHVCQ